MNPRAQAALRLYLYLAPLFLLAWMPPLTLITTDALAGYGFASVTTLITFLLVGIRLYDQAHGIKERAAKSLKKALPIFGLLCIGNLLIKVLEGNFSALEPYRIAMRLITYGFIAPTWVIAVPGWIDAYKRRYPSTAPEN